MSRHDEILAISKRVMETNGDFQHDIVSIARADYIRLLEIAQMAEAESRFWEARHKEAKEDLRDHKSDSQALVDALRDHEQSMERFIRVTQEAGSQVEFAARRAGEAASSLESAASTAINAASMMERAARR